MSTLFVGLSVWVPSAGVGVAIVRGGEPVDAASILPFGRDVCALRRTITQRGEPLGVLPLVRDLIAKHGDEGDHVVWAVEAQKERRRPERQQQRAASHRGDVQRAGAAVKVLHTALVTALDGLPADAGAVLDVPYVGAVDAACPESLKRNKPAHFAGQRGQDRRPQRTAWTVAEVARRTLSQIDPEDPDPDAAYLKLLGHVARACRPLTPDDWRVAAATALAVVARPSSAPVLPPDQLAQHLKEAPA